MKREYDFSAAKRAKDAPHLVRIQNSGSSATRSEKEVSEGELAQMESELHDTRAKIAQSSLEIARLSQLIAVSRARIDAGAALVQSIETDLQSPFPQIPIFAPEIERALLEHISRALEGNASVAHKELAEISLKALGESTQLILGLVRRLKFEREFSGKLNAIGKLTVVMEKEALSDKIKKDTKTVQGKSVAVAKLENDPKQKAKAKIFQEYKRWMANQSNFRDGAKFALKMVELHRDKDGAPLLTTKTVEGWVTLWRKDAKQKAQNPVS